LNSFFNKANLMAGLLVGVITFLIALLMSLGSEALVRAVNNVLIAIILLLFVIFLGIFFDILGTAATAAQLAPYNARAAKKVFGAKQAVRIKSNAHKVANYFNDVIGDIAGTLSGAIGAGIVVSLINQFATLDVVLMGGMMTSLIAALTVGGKAIGKSFAIKNANDIIFRLGVVLAYWEKYTHTEFLR
jgi:CBS domain containing-hemolysin-like protein